MDGYEYLWCMHRQQPVYAGADYYDAESGVWEYGSVAAGVKAAYPVGKSAPVYKRFINGNEIRGKSFPFVFLPFFNSAKRYWGWKNYEGYDCISYKYR